MQQKMSISGAVDDELRRTEPGGFHYATFQLVGASGVIGMPLIRRLRAPAMTSWRSTGLRKDGPGWPPRERPPSGSTCSVPLPWSGPCKGSAPTR